MRLFNLHFGSVNIINLKHSFIRCKTLRGKFVQWACHCFRYPANIASPTTSPLKNCRYRIFYHQTGFQIQTKPLISMMNNAFPCNASELRIKSHIVILFSPNPFIALYFRSMWNLCTRTRSKAVLAVPSPLTHTQSFCSILTQLTTNQGQSRAYVI